MISVGLCRAALLAGLQAMPALSAAKIYDSSRQVLSEDEARTYFLNPTTRVWHAWWFSAAPAEPITTERAGQFATAGSAGGGLVRSTYRFQIEGFYGVDDAHGSQTVWEDLVDAVAQFLNSYGLLATTDVRRQEPCQVHELGFITFARSVDLHYARLSIGFSGRTAPGAWVGGASGTVSVQAAL